MVAIYRDAVKVLAQFWPLILVYAAVLEAVSLLVSVKGGVLGAYILLQVQFAYAVHRYCLFGEAMNFGNPAIRVRPQRTGRFMLVSVAVIAIVVGVAVFAARKLDPGRSENSVYVLLLGFVLLGSLLVLSLIGTVLPAAAAGDPLGPAFGLPRLRATFGWVFRGLLVGPAVTGLAGFELLGFAGRAVGPDAGKVVTFAFGVAGTALGMVNTIFAVVVLCRVYRLVVPADPIPTDPMPGPLAT